MLDKVLKKIFDECLIDLVYSVESFTLRIDPAVTLLPYVHQHELQFFLSYHRRPDCQFLRFVALQTCLSVTGEMSLLYIKQFVCLGEVDIY